MSEALLRPAAVMLVGASRDPRKPGGAILRNLVGAKPPFRVHAVNPHRIELPGAQWSPTVGEVPERCDLAVVAVPAPEVPGAVAAIARNGAKVVVLITAGLGGAALEETLCVARAAGVRLIGPNCLGLLVPPAGLDASFAAGGASSGRLAFLSQSGALATAVLDWSRGRGIGFSAVLSLGDMADVGLDELVRLFGRDERTSALLIYLEGLADARPFLRAVRDLAGRKPVIVLKAGRTHGAALAAQSHTGALAGAHDVYRAAFRQHGVVMVDSLDDLFTAASVLSRCPRASGARLAMVTNGGGAGVLAADAMVDGAGALAILSETTRATLDASLPVGWSHANPVDIIGDADGARYRSALAALFADPKNDAVLVMNCPTALHDCAEIAQAVIETVQKSGTTKPVLACWLGETNARRAADALAAAGIPLFETPEQAVRGFSYLVQAARAAPPEPYSGRKPSAETMSEVRRLIGDVRADGRRVMSELEAKALLARFGIPVVPTLAAATPEAVHAVCRKLEGPYVVKIVSRDLTHKSDLGGVVLGLADADAAMYAAKAMHDHIRSVRPEARLEGFAVQPMIRRKRAHELFCGIAADPAFGPVLMFGAGGTGVEVIADRAIRLPPIDRRDAAAMIAETRVFRLLAGYRDVLPARREAIVEVLVALSDLICEVPEIAELDVNPLLADADGVLALDARVILSEPPGSG